MGPGKGLHTSRKNDLIGKAIHRHIPKNTFFFDEDLETNGNGGFPHPSTYSFQSKWGLIARFNDFFDIISFDPEVIEIHLAEKDFATAFIPERSYRQELIIHAPEFIDGEIINLCHSDHAVRSKSVGLVQRTIALAREMSPCFQGTPKIVVHPDAVSLKRKATQDSLAKCVNAILI